MPGEEHSAARAYVSVDLDTLSLSNPKSIGVEHLLYAMITELGLDEKLQSLALTPMQFAAAMNGVYCLRTNNKQLDEAALWRSYTTLTDLEAVFRSLKSELGLRPIYHQKQSRVDGHLFITLLAYSIIHSIRYRLKAKGIHESWESIRQTMKPQTRVTTTLQCEDGRTVHIRKSSQPGEKQKELMDVLQFRHAAGEATRVYV